MSSVIYLENGLCPQNRRVERLTGSIRELSPDWQTPYVAFVDGKPVLRADWNLIPNEDQSLIFIDADAIPQGGGGGGGSNPLRTVLMLAVMVYAPTLAGKLAYSLGGGEFLGSVAGLNMLQAGITFAGMALVNMVAPAPKPTSPQQAAALAAASPTYSLQAQGNTARLESAIPEHFGRHIVYPDFAANPYTEYAGNEQYLYQLLCVGRGSYDLETLKIEDTPISSFNEITTEVIQPYGQVTLFPAAVTTSIEVSGQTLSPTIVGPFIANAEQTLVNKLAFDFVAYKGLYYANNDGSLASRTVYITIEVATVNDYGTLTSAWSTLESNKPFTAATTTAQRWSWSYPVALGRYITRVKRSDDESTLSREANSVAWAGLRAYHPDPAGKNYGDVTLIAVRMKASDNLSSQASRKMNLIATRKLPIWNGSSWSALTATRNPAWALAYAAKQVGQDDTSIDLAGLLTLANGCTSRGDNFDARFDSFLSFWEAATKICQSVRAKPFIQGSVLRVVRDQASAIPVAMFSQRNIVKGSFSVNYLMPTEDTADSVDVSYFDDIKWATAKVRSTLAGSTAAKPAKIDIFGVTSRAQAWREGLYQAACNRYRRKMITFKTEMEGFIPSFLDLATLQHDMPAWGQSGEVVAWNSGTKTLTLSEPPVFTTGVHYIALRDRGGAPKGPYACVVGSNPYEVVLSESPAFTPYVGMDEERTHFAFGAGIAWSQPVRILTAKPVSFNQVEITAVNEDASVHTADAGVTMPMQVFSQLAGYQNAPQVLGVVARFLFNYPNMATVSWQPTPWANKYEVQSSSGDGVWSHVSETSATSLNFTATYGKTTLVRVAASNLSRGAWAQSTIAIVPPFDPTGLSYTQELGGVRIKWDERLETNFYELRQGASWDTATLIAPVTGTEYLWSAQPTGTITLWLKSIDANGNYSTNAISLNAVITGPGAPDATYETAGPDEVLSWTIPTSGFTVDRYEIRQGASWSAGVKVDSTKATSYRRKVDYAGARTYWIAAVDVKDNYGEPDSLSVNVSIPSAVTSPRTEVIDNNVLLFWNPPTTGTLPVDRYEVRKGSSWASGTVVGSNGNSTFAAIFEQSSGMYTYWIAAVDSAGNFGVAASIVAAVSQPPDYILRNDINSTFSGTKVNALLFEGGLLLPVNATETWTQHFVNNGYATPQAQITAGNPLYIEPGMTSATYTEDIDYGTTLPATTINVTLNSTAVTGTVTSSCQIKYSNVSATGPWTNAPVGATSTLATNFRWVQVIYTFTAAGGHNLLKVNALNIKLAVKNRTDSGSGVITNATTGVYVPFGYAFIDADTPIVQPQGAVPLIAVVDYTDTPNPTGFTVYLYTTAGVKTTGSFSWTVRGY